MTPAHIRRILAVAAALSRDPLDVKKTQETFARLMVPQVADWAAVHVKQGADDTVAVAHAGGREDLVWQLLKRYPPDPNWPHGYPYVIRTGQPDLVPVVTPDLLKQIAVDAENLKLLLVLDLRSWLCLPFHARIKTAKPRCARSLGVFLS